VDAVGAFNAEARVLHDDVVQVVLVDDLETVAFRVEMVSHEDGLT
jgi:hypothetical protein